MSRLPKSQHTEALNLIIPAATMLQFTTYSLLFLVVLTFVTSVVGDMGFYRDTNAHYMGADYPNLLSIPTIHAEITTSTASLAGTEANILATFIGEFSSSGPHSIGGFEQGATVTVPVKLDREIGVLKSVIVATESTDGWLLSKMRCRINKIQYDLEGPLQWVDKFSPALFADYKNGYEPDSQDKTIGAASTLKLTVTGTQYIFSPRGLVDLD